LASAAAAWSSAAGVPLIDGLGLPAFANVAHEFAGRGAVALIHHPVSLEAGLADDEQARLHMVEARLFPLFGRLVVTSDTTAATLAQQFGVAAERISVVAPGTADAPRCAGSGGPTCHILALGAFIPRKGHDVLLRALARLFDLDWRLTIAGSGADSVHARTLAALAEELGVAQRVTFAGALVDDALAAMWQSADLFALATHYEGYGMAIAEALKRGLPCAICAGGAAGKLVPPEAGAVCEPGDVVTLSKSLRRMIFDTDLRRMMAEAAFQAGAKLPGWADQARAFADVIEGKSP
jgi:glycosyltransferase involved in cell wall biosynthesis